ncbi:MAG: D-glycero-beta-D-manno-heptose-7-phosphate kinase [Bacteroidales bacterium]|nr:D-glycero-beta-D-manno-heptose-7-phosphate kinase [Bacteroidales bacterium]
MKSLKESFKNKKILIIGDVMIDAYIWGHVDRISPEAPVPVVSVQKRESRMGGAANVAMNIQVFGSTPVLASVIGNDEQAVLFEKILKENNMPSDGLLKNETRKTTTKFRIIGNNMQMLRVDDETDSALSEKLQSEFISHITSLFKKYNFDAIIFEDYDKGVVFEKLIETVVNEAKEKKIPVLVDPKKRNFNSYKNITVFKPNLKELKDALNTELPNDIEGLAACCEDFRVKQNIDCLQLTLGERGMLICYNENNKAKYMHIPSRVRKVADVSGAGDTVISVSSLAISSGLTLTEMAEISNIAAGIVCEHVGVVPVDIPKFWQSLESINFR